MDDKDISIVLDKWQRDEVYREAMKPVTNDDIVWEVWVEPIYNFSSLCMSFEDRVKEFGITPEFIKSSKEQNSQLNEQLSGFVFVQHILNTAGIHHFEARDKATGKLIAYTVVVMDGLKDISGEQSIYLDCTNRQNSWSPSTFHRIEGMYPLGLQ